MVDFQGLGANLAYFLARCGLEALDNTNAPLVFERLGRPRGVAGWRSVGGGVALAGDGEVCRARGM